LVEMGDEGNSEICLLSEIWLRAAGALHPARAAGSLGPAWGTPGGRTPKATRSLPACPGGGAEPVPVSVNKRRTAPSLGTAPLLCARAPRETLTVTATSGENQKHKCNTKAQLLQSAWLPWVTHLPAPLRAPGRQQGLPCPLLAAWDREHALKGGTELRVARAHGSPAGRRGEGEHSKTTALESTGG